MSENNQMMSVEGQLVGMPLAGPESFSQQQLDYLKRALGVDETVLWDNGTTTSATLSEGMSNFERVRFYFVRGEGRQFVQEVTGSSNDGTVILFHSIAYTNGWISTFSYRYSVSGTSFSPTEYAIELAIKTGTTTVTVRTTTAPTIVKVVGIHRIAGGNT